MSATAVVVAADGGNSKTDVVVASLDGTVLARRTVVGTRPHLDGGLAAMADMLAEGVRATCADADLGSATPRHGTFCLANVDVVEDEVITRAELLGRGVAQSVTVHNDTLAVLRAGTDETWGVAVVAGAGVNAVGVHPDGRTHRFLALGDFTGDWGGGFSLGTGAVGAAVRAEDGRGGPTVLSDTVPRLLGRPDVRSVAIAIHRGELGEHDLLRLAPLVLEAASAGDGPARDLVLRLALELSEFAGAAIRGLHLGAEPVPVVLGGGIAQSGNQVLLTRFTELLHHTARRARVSVLDVAPVAGAVVTALRNAGAPDAALVRARAQLARPASVGVRSAGQTAR